MRIYYYIAWSLDLEKCSDWSILFRNSRSDLTFRDCKHQKKKQMRLNNLNSYVNWIRTQVSWHSLLYALYILFQARFDRGKWGGIYALKSKGWEVMGWMPTFSIQKKSQRESRIEKILYLTELYRLCQYNFTKKCQR